MKRKPLEGINSLLFTIGASLGYFLAHKECEWWVIVFVVVICAVAADQLVEFLKRKNK